MRIIWKRFVSVLTAFSFAVILAGQAPAATKHLTALDRYVHSPDPQYRYDLAQTSHWGSGTIFSIRMVSQSWRTSAEVTQPVWLHWVEIYVPEKVTATTGLLLIAGGHTSNQVPNPNLELEDIAASTHSVVTELRNVPNEPLTFVGDPHGPRSEDSIIAYTWRRYMDTGDSSWPLRLPMTKAAVKAMDTVTSFLATPAGGSLRVDHFVVAGASKRGWTTWTTAAVDPRVVAIVPMVIDVLNVVPSFEHHYRTYGFWSSAVKDYADEGLLDQLRSKQFRNLMKIEDPYVYRARFTMPKLLIFASSDQFFLPDSSRFYFNHLPGEKHILYEPNADHSLRGSTAYGDLTAFYLSILKNTKRPNLSWHLDRHGVFHVTTDETPTKVVLWEATNPLHRDFRLVSIGAAYHATPLKPVRKGVYEVHLQAPAKGWSAFYVEAEFPSDGATPLHLSTQVQVLPDIEPYTFPRDGHTKLEPEPIKSKKNRSKN